MSNELQQQKIEDEIKLINNFIVDNAELDDLSDRLSQFNVFDVLGIANYEIRHSNTLAWLFDPKGQHGFVDLFFKRFLTKIINEIENNLDINPAKIELANYSDILIFREWRNIDLLIVSELNNQVIIIENKIKAKESKGQLEKYHSTVKDEWKKFKIIPIFLTLEGDEPSLEAKKLDYMSVKLEMVQELLERQQFRFSANQSQGVSEFITDYIDILKRLNMQDIELMKLCKTIYKRHRTAIDLIVSYGSSSEINAACIEALQDEGIDADTGSIVQDIRGMVFFLPKIIVDIITEFEMNHRWSFLKYQAPFYCWFMSCDKGTKLQICIEVGPVINHGKRVEILNMLEDSGLNFTKKAFDESAIFSRGYSKKVSIENCLGEEDEFNKIKTKAKGLLKNINLTLEVIAANYNVTKLN